MTEFAIGDVSEKTGLSHDTLRYYEKLGLLKKVARDAGGRRRYDDSDLSRLAFIQRAQAVNFSLQEIGQLLKFRDNPVAAKPDVLNLTQRKYQEVVAQIEQLDALRTELDLLLNLCRRGSGGECPIIESLDNSERAAKLGQ